MVLEKFEKVENKNLEPNKFLGIPIVEEHQKHYKLTPVKDHRKLVLIFPVTAGKDSYLFKVDRVRNGIFSKRLLVLFSFNWT
jgi:hypothetical protein